MAERPRILVVDDDLLILEVVKELLGDDYEVTTAASGEEALEHLARVDYAVLLADQRMPGLTGVELAARARAMQPHLVAVLLSAYTDPVDMIAAINEGQIYRFVRKPWDMDDLLLTLQQAAQRYALTIENARLVQELGRRLRAVEILQDVLKAASVMAGRHPADVLLQRLEEVIEYDLAGLLLAPEPGGHATLQVKSRDVVAEQSVLDLRDQLLELLAYSGGELPEEQQLDLVAAATLDPSASPLPVESQIQVPLQLDGRVVGVLAVQSFGADAYPPDTARLLDLLANGTAEAVARMRELAGERRRQLEQALAALPQGVVLADARGVVQVANRAARRMLGLQRAGSLWELLGTDPAEVTAAGAAGLRRELCAGERRVAVSALHSRGGKIGEESYLLVLRDLTELEAEEARRREILSTLSHEIRTPLTSLIATIDLLLQEFAGPLNPKQLDYLQVAARAGETLNQMISDLLDLERFARGAVTLQRLDADMARLAAGILARHEAAAREYGLALTLEDGSEPVRANVDPMRIEQVIGNLVGNAVKFATEGSTISVRVAAASRLPGWVVLGVHNQGEAIPPAELPTLFARFRQGKQGSDRARSSGLGLAISRSIAEAHGGALFAESSAAGTWFWLAVPAVAAAPNTAASFGPVWVDSEAAAPERVALAAVLRGCGLGAALLPQAPELAAAMRAAAGSGIVVSTRDGHSALVPPLVRLTWAAEPGATAVGEAIAALARQRGDRVEVPAGGEALHPLLDALDIAFARADKVVPPQAGAVAAAALVSLAQQLSPQHRRRAPARDLLARLATRPEMGVGVVRLEHLDAFRALYGVRRQELLRQALRAEVARCMPPGHEGSLDAVPLEDGLLLAGPASLVREVVAEVERRFPAVARLHHRKQDREQGCVCLGGERVPLVGMRSLVLEPGAGEAEVLAAAGL